MTAGAGAIMLCIVTGASDSPATIRPYDAAHDREALGACVIEQQDFHRGLESSWPEGHAIVDRYVRYLEDQSAAHDGRILVAEQAGDIVGFISVASSTQGESPDDPATYAWIHDVFVKATHRRRGLARRLMAEAESFARARGARQLRLGVLSSNQSARAMYRELGFREYVNVLSKGL